MSETFNPYRKWLGIPPEDQPPNHYRLLGIAPFEDDPDVIAYAADRQMSHVRKFQAGHYGADAQKLLGELAQARRCLLSASERAPYDRQLRSAISHGASGGHAPVAVPQPTKTSALPSPPPPQAVPPQAVPPQAVPPQPQTVPPQPAPPQASAVQAQPSVPTMEVPQAVSQAVAQATPQAVPRAVASGTQSGMAVRPRSVSSTSRRGRRKNSALLLVATVFALVGFGLVAMLVVVAMSSELESDPVSDGSSYVTPPSPTPTPTPTLQQGNEPSQPPRLNRPRPKLPRLYPNPPKEQVPLPPANPPQDSLSDPGVPSEGPSVPGEGPKTDSGGGGDNEFPQRPDELPERPQEVGTPSLPAPGENDELTMPTDGGFVVDDPGDDLPQLPADIDPGKGLPALNGPAPDNIPGEAPVAP